MQLEGKTWLMGDTLTLAGGHLFIVSNWAPRGGVGPSDEEHRLARREHLAKRPAVQTALQTQGLLG